MPEQKTTDLSIAGMTCASCVSRVTRSLERVPGVSAAHVNLATERAVITHAPDVPVDSLTQAVAQSGYAALPAAPHWTQDDDADAVARDDEIAKKRRLLVLGVLLFIPSLLLGMTPIDFPGKDWAMLALALPIWAVVGWEFHRGALSGLRHASANMDTLVSLGSTTALAYSMYATLVMRPTYYETAAAIIVLVYIGKYLETAARGKTNVAIRRLLSLRPSMAVRRSPDGSQQAISVDEVRTGDVVIVRPGDRIPVDGFVAAGASAVDTSMLTGEATPHEVGPGATVVGGTINGDGVLEIRATDVGSGSVLARIVKIVADAQGSQSPVQRLADRVAGVFVPAILVVAALTFAGWVATGRAWGDALVVAVAVLIVACPCAMGLATPTAVMVGIGAGAKFGLLFKSAVSLERAGNVTIVVFDKTGTVTLGKPSIQSIVPAAGIDRNDVLALAAAAEQASSHPFAAAILRAASDRGIALPPSSGGGTERGRGVRASIGGADVLVGTRRFMEEQGISVDGLARSASIDGGVTRIYVARAGTALGAIDVSDEVRPDARAAVDELRQLGMDVALVSGDAAGPVARVAAALGISTFKENELPEDKVEFVRRLQSSGNRVAFVGDGINDAPALAAADVGLAMGGGTEIAMEAADAAIVSNDPRAVAAAIRLSRATMRTIKQNLFWAFAYNVVLVPLAAFGYVHPILAAGAMGLSSVFVVGNSLLLKSRL